MELRLNIDYKQILGLIHQLSKTDIQKLVTALQSEVMPKKSQKSIQELIINAPTWSVSDMDNYQKARNHISKSRIG